MTADVATLSLLVVVVAGKPMRNAGDDEPILAPIICLVWPLGSYSPNQSFCTDIRQDELLVNADRRQPNLERRDFLATEF